MEKQINTKKLEVGDIVVQASNLRSQFPIDRVDEKQAYSGEAHFNRVPENGHYPVEGYSHMPNSAKYILYTFKDQVKYDLIPRIQIMLLKEEQHQLFLKESKEKLSTYPDSLVNTTEIGEMLDNSLKYSKHYAQRIEQYTEYINS